ncbi:DUF1294 domain-containing protein [Eubacteriales bacterium OttesenSCG-928-G02]|nr:DUF1294 domain-containing protein [Eubacteriales bacterium OttesenSCG-928-G02]
MGKYIIFYIAVVSIIGIIFVVYDKAAAQNKMSRISEKTLFIFGALGGAFFMFIAMQLVRHKTKKVMFMTLFPLLAIIHLVLMVMLFYGEII